MADPGTVLLLFLSMLSQDLRLKELIQGQAHYAFRFLLSLFPHLAANVLVTFLHHCFSVWQISHVDLAFKSEIKSQGYFTASVWSL